MSEKKKTLVVTKDGKPTKGSELFMDYINEKEYQDAINKMDFDKYGFKYDTTGKVIQTKEGLVLAELDVDGLELLKEFYAGYINEFYKKQRALNIDWDNATKEEADKWGEYGGKALQVELMYKQAIEVYWDLVNKKK